MATIDADESEPRSNDRLRLHPDDALLIVDLQRDFLPGGALPVPGGDAVVMPVNNCIARFLQHGLPVYASRDWHPEQHCSFRSAGGPWPPHCVAGSAGAAFADALRLPGDAQVVSKGTAASQDAYSAFGGTDLHARLRARHVLRLFVAGLATDYCVQASVLDALALGYLVVVVRDAVAAVEMQAGDGERALQRMCAAGAMLAASAQLC
jgi:nicotinamidase/pyrazinamidase